MPMYSEPRRWASRPATSIERRAERESVMPRLSTARPMCRWETTSRTTAWGSTPCRRSRREATASGTAAMANKMCSVRIWSC